MKIAVGLSGGVDSAVSAAILQKQGHDVLAVFLWCYQTKDFPCTTDQDRAMAVRVADHLHIPIKIIDLRRDYRRSVVDYFFAEYKAGRTPNPDVVCNKEIKFGLFYQQMIEKEKFDFVATGHYARIKKDLRLKTYDLRKGIDEGKDQSYFLYTLKESQLEHIMFPVGGYKKEQVRQMASEFKLPNAKRPDSQGICFIGEVDVKKFLKTKLKPKKGLVRSPDGEVIGEHEGVWFYTIGQRHGFNITENRKLKVEDRNRKPLFILSKNSERNELIVGEKDDCYTKKLEITNVHWINKPENKSLTVRIRHLGEMYPCKIIPSVIPTERRLTSEVEESSEARSVLDPSTTLGMTYKVILAKPAFAVASGQSAVLYNNDIVLGGGIIK